MTYYKESWRKATSYMQKKEGRITEMATYFTAIAF
jgi:hypothetical protein